jgi:hypothetical protein
MKVQVDVELLRAAAVPLRQAVAVVDELATVRAELRESALPIGEQVLARSVEDFLDAWSGGLAAVGQRGRALAGMLELAAGQYGAIEHKVRGQAREAGS